VAPIDPLASVRRSPLGTFVIAALLIASGWLLIDALGDRQPRPGGSPRPSGIAAPTPVGSGPLSSAGQPTPTAGEPTTSPIASPDPASPGPATPTPSPTAVPVGNVDMPFVPVLGFWTTERTIDSERLASAISDAAQRYARVALPVDDAGAIAAALGVELGPHVELHDVDGVRAAVAQGALGVLRLTDVDHRVRALELDGVSLFGNQRIAGFDDWPLRASVVGPPPPDQAATWTLVAGGDVMLDRAVGQKIFTERRGPEYPWDGGTARITRIVCCSSFDWPIPRTERTGNEGAVRALFSGGDLAIANLETAVRRDATPNLGGLTFVSHPSTLAAMADAGFDFVSLANNHIGNGGPQGILTAIEVLDELGVAHAGAGRTAAEALAPATFEVNGTRVAILACDWIAPRYWVRDDRVGAQSCRHDTLVDGIRAAANEAELVIVFPHWGKEYRAEPRAYQRRLADAWTAAGADMVIGAHSHWAGAIEDIGGKLVFYSLGNLVFDQSWQAQTQMGVILELTFRGDQVVQAWLHPTVILDQAQPNLLTTDEDLRRVLDQMRDGSEGLLDY
jgi:poly-gamma-glutamate capsule biosynthesis protein CapA/YwtB (metallophosphatase superfamily)